MAKINLRKLRPAALARLLNSTPRGEVVSARTIYRQRNRAGYRVGDGTYIDLLRYVAWLAEDRRRRGAEATAGGYEAHKEQARRRAAEQSAAGRDIGDLPEVEDWSRRRTGLASYQAFCEIYFPETFYLPWSKDHGKVIEKLERAVVIGGLFALAMPRASGKTSLCEVGCIWGIVKGAHKFVALIGSDEGHAKDMLDSIKTELESNDLLAADFPEVCYPIWCLEGIANRCTGQLCHGQRTLMEWTAKEIVLPTLPDDVLAAAGISLDVNGTASIVKVTGITGKIRGMKHKRSDGRPVRPSLVVVDDPQTTESARSETQCQSREETLAGAVLGLAGPGEKISGIMPCTVIYPGDMADRILDRNEHPEWQGERTRMVYEFPENEELWEKYAEILKGDLRNDGDGSTATEFYREHREEMDAGSVVAWPERHEPDELSGIQSAMNLKIRDEASFWAEYQNEPIPPPEDDKVRLEADDILQKLNGRKRRAIPEHVEHLTAYIDVQKTMLFYVVAAWEANFTGYVVDYGTFPDQHRRYFSLRNAQQTLERIFSGQATEGRVYSALDTLVPDLLNREWLRDDGALMPISLCLIDQGWQADVVHQFCRQSSHTALLMPGRGQGIAARMKPISEYVRGRGDRIGFHWWIPSVRGKRRSLRHLEIDTNYWKSFVHARFATAMGERGCLSLWGRNTGRHRLFSEHVTAEYYVQTEGRGRRVDEWAQPAHRPDNHWFDCLVGCTAAASVRGASLSSTGEQSGVAHERTGPKLSELQSKKRGRRGR